MSRITLTPFCVSRTKDKDALIKTRAIFKSPLAIMFGLRAVVQGYVINTGQVSMDRKPVLLLRDTETGEDALLDGSQINPCNGMTRQPAEELVALACVRSAHDCLQYDMLNVSSHRLWLIATPSLVIMQARDIVQELRTAGQISNDLRCSTWARAAYATLRLPPPESTHETLSVLGAIPETLSLLQNLHPAAVEDARSHGYDLGPFTADDLRRAVADGRTA